MCGTNEFVIMIGENLTVIKTENIAVVVLTLDNNN